MVALLIENEADVNVKDNCKRRPIDVARQHKHYSVVEYMLEQEIHEGRLVTSCIINNINNINYFNVTKILHVVLQVLKFNVCIFLFQSFCM